MFRSVLQKFRKTVFFMLAAFLCLLHCSFTPPMSEQEMLDWANKCLSQSYDPSAEGNLKTWQLTLTDDGFIRLRKNYQKGKVEYYSFQLHRLSDMGYLGSTAVGTLQLKTLADDIIVQTYGDREGDVDSMSTQLNLPVKDMEPERLDSLQMVLDYFKKKDL
jgi:hypothetical protein